MAAGDHPCGETIEKWEWCATQVIKAGASDLYKEGVTHITDRCKGIPYFDVKFEGMSKMHCGHHLLANVQKEGKKHKEFFRGPFLELARVPQQGGSGSELHCIRQLPQNPGLPENCRPQTVDQMLAE